MHDQDVLTQLRDAGLLVDALDTSGALQRVPLTCRIDTLDELEYFKNGGILQYVLRQLAA